jgi:uncharacterized membrane protein YfcA
VDAIELLAVAAWSFAVAVAGGLAGLVLGNLRLPVLVLVGSSPAAAAGANVAVSGLAALSATVTHAREGRVERPLFVWMAPASLAGAIAGGLVSGALPSRVLLAFIAVVVLYGALEVYRYERPIAVPAASRRELILNAAAIGLVVGVIGGIVGLILGSLRLPALIRWAGVSPAAAVGTNSAVGVVVGAGGLIGHLPSGVDWALLGAGAAGAIPGAYLGARLVGRLDERALLRTIALILVIAGSTMAIQAVAG